MTKQSVPTYETDEEIHAARQMHGAAYDRLVARKAIKAPTREDLPDTELAERIAKVSERKAAKGKGSKRSAKRSTAKKSSAKKSAKRPSRAKKSKADAPASESTSSE